VARRTRSAGAGRIGRGTDQFDPSVGSPDVVDALSSDLSVAALCTDAPTVYVPSPTDIERLAVVIDELTADSPPAGGRRHLVVRSLTPILETVAPETVARSIDCSTDACPPTGLCLGYRYTAHGDAALDSLVPHVDGILWVERSTSGEITFEFDHRG
jgi:hypothetical protein